MTPEAAVAAQRAGHQNVFVLRGGFSEWQSRRFPVSVK
ncbi:MAG: rhodanese-like domain-containing protein [Desulfobulbaceae bacterium]|nr:MAG: rhodanese-like domain-containing protein [Desulfobulbaceae bacterium]